MKKKILFISVIAFAVAFLYVCCSQPSSHFSKSEHNKVPSKNNNEVFGFVDIKDRTLEVGDVIFNDGTVLPYNKKFTKEQYNSVDLSKALAVIFRADEPEVPQTALGVGLNIGKNLAWAKKDSVGFSRYFEFLKAYPNTKYFSHVTPQTTFRGFNDGIYSWEIISRIDPVDSQNSKENYPAFHYAITYGKTQENIQDTAFSKNWFLPSLAEMAAMYNSRKILNDVFEKIGKEKISNENSGNSFFWTSTDVHYRTESHEGALDYFVTDAAAIDMNDGYMDHGDKSVSERRFVCAVREFY